MLPTGTSTICKTGAFNSRALGKDLPKGFPLDQTATQSFSGDALDTFEAHLRKRRQILVQTKDKLRLIDLKELSFIEQSISRDWNFAEELDAGDVRFQCLDVSKLRAFKPVFQIEVLHEQWAVRDELQKIVVRLETLALVCGSKKAVWILLRSLRGYEPECKRVYQTLKESGYSVGSDYYPMLGINREIYDPKPFIPITPNEAVSKTANTIVLTFLEVAQMNEQGVLNDLDTEFIHDYRVSLRRIRSLISLFKGVYSEDFTADMKSRLAGIMKQTNRLRDLDVYLLERHQYYELVPANMYAGLDIMFGIFEAERAEAQCQVRTLFQSAEYAREMKQLKSAFQTLEKPAHGSRASDNSLAFAKKVILKRYRKIAMIAKSINEKTPDETVHELRIECKKLRYLIEFSAPMFPSKKIKGLIRSLKGLQDVLGRFNDYSVQQESLSQFVKVHPMRGKRGLKLAESIGALVATLYQLQKRARNEVEQHLDDFLSWDIADAFEDLFSKGLSK